MAGLPSELKFCRVGRVGRGGFRREQDLIIRVLLEMDFARRGVSGSSGPEGRPLVNDQAVVDPQLDTLIALSH